MHTRVSGVADHLAENDDHTLQIVRDIVAALPPSPGVPDPAAADADPAAVEVADRIGANGAAAIDIAAACAGFCYGVAMASDMIRGGSARYIVVVGVEKLTDWVNPEDRGTAFIFADGAGAVVVGPSDEPAIGPVVWGADGTQSKACLLYTSRCV